MNPRQVSEIRLSPDVVDCIVFWTKNPLPMMERLDELKEYSYYFQFTLTGYGNDVEANLPDKETAMIPIFRNYRKGLAGNASFGGMTPFSFLTAIQWSII